MGMASIPFKPKRKVWRCKTRQQPSKQQTSVAHVLEAVSTPVKMSTLCDYIWCHFSSVQSLSCPFATPWTAVRQASLSITNSQSLLKLISIVSDVPSNHLIPSSPPPTAFSLSKHQGLFKWVSPLHQVAKVLGVSASTSVPPTNTQDQSPLGWTGWISLLSRNSQESSPTPQFKSIDSLALSFLYSPTLTSIHDYWKNYSFD